MEAKSILAADVLDIIFDERNKEYGAYDLRKNYRRRLTKALSATFLFAGLFCLSYVLMSAVKKTDDVVVHTGPDVILDNAPDKPIDPPPPPPPPPKLPESTVRTIKDMIPLIVKDDVQTEMPEQDEIDNARIGKITSEGVDDPGLIEPTGKPGSGVVEITKKPEANSDDFVPVEVESTYPGGLSAWALFLGRNLNYPQSAADNEIQGTVMVQFVVDAQGVVSDITAISGPDELKAAAVAVIKKSGKWTPALQNGRYVKSHKRQPITFKLEG